jgi:MYXO-CTERM domain-containing protein
MTTMTATFRYLAPLLLAAPLVAPIALIPNHAQACGGTFCDNNGGLPMPVDQRGEDILFMQNGPEIEVHVRIQYTGEAEQFAWLVPLQSLPEISVGSDRLFTELGIATAPRWLTNLEYACAEEDPDDWGGGGFVPENDVAQASEPDLVIEQTVGAFEVVVLQGGDVPGIMQFLQQNGYEQDLEAAPILQEYLDEGFLFAAVKLSAGAEVEEIHPLVFRMFGDEPCVPLRLTRIAAEPDMGVRVYFLNKERWAPQNYLHIELNTLAFAWSELGGLNDSRARYTEQLALAVDLAGGHAFATDYAGDSEIVSTSGLFEGSWDEAAFIGVDPITAIDLITSQLLGFHPLIQPLLMQFIPPPDGVNPQDFWNDIEAYEELIDHAAWDSEAFAAALSERIIEPGLHAVEILETWPYLTRMVTTISPEEMTVDPVFMAAPDLEEVSNEKTAEGIDLCGENGTHYQVPWSDNPLPVCVAEFAEEWPELLSQYPVRHIQQIPQMGPPQLLQDFTPEIAADWLAHQIEQGCAEPPGGEDDGDGGDGTGDGGADQGSGTGDAGQIDRPGAAGCGCRSSDDETPLGFAFGFGLLGLAILRRGTRV